MPYSNLGAFKKAYRADTESYEYKKSHNAVRDYEQYNRWKETLGNKDMPESLAEFQKMKYNDIDKFKAISNRIVFTNKFKTNEFSLELHEGKQGKHILGHNNYDNNKSVIVITNDEIKELVKAKHGTGKILITDKGTLTNKEIIKNENYVGYCVENNKKVYTKYLTIHYSKTGFHVVPKKMEDKND